MRNPSVHWVEGLFLRPHHFQAMERCWKELLQFSFDSAVSSFYGIGSATLTLDTRGVLEISKLSVRWKDGLTYRFVDGQVERLDLSSRIPSEVRNQPITLSIAVPQIRADKPLVNDDPVGRFSETFMEFVDETTVTDAQQIAFLRPNLKWLFQHEASEGMELIPIARIVSAANGEFLLDEQFVPSCLAIHASQNLVTKLSELQDKLRNLSAFLGAKLARRIGRSGLPFQADPDRSQILLMLNEATCELSLLSSGSLVHPWDLYRTLCRIIAKFSILRPNLIPAEPLSYNHDELGDLFQWAFTELHGLLDQIREDSFEQRYLTGQENGLSVDLDENWFDGSWDWYFAVEPMNVGRDECLYLLKKHINWKLGSAGSVDEYMSSRQSGIALRPILDLPKSLPSDRGWIYFQIACENEAWELVKKGKEMTMRVSPEMISNKESLKGSRRLVLKVEDEVFAFEFAVFVVRKDS